MELDIDIKGAVVCYSGGCDSLTLLHLVMGAGIKPIHVLTFDYNQRHKKEIQYATKICGDYQLPQFIYHLNLHEFGRSPLVDPKIDVPPQFESKQELTVVPYRNTMFLVNAAAHATIHKLEAVFIGAVYEDLSAYPDCRPEYFNIMQRALRLADNHHHLRIIAPFNTWQKDRIIKLGHIAYHIDYSKAWTCYKGGEKHCGVCDACIERKVSFKSADLIDPTEYDQ